MLQVSRFVPEKRQLDLCAHFVAAAPNGWKLALVGTTDLNDSYTREVMRAAGDNPNVVLTGFQQGQDLHELYGHAGLFVLPSSHEGLPIALLEALSFGLPVIASDIPANIELGLPTENYFPVGDLDGLARRILHFTQKSATSEKSERVREIRSWLGVRYDWQTIAGQTLEVYSRAIGASATHVSSERNRG